MRVLVKQISKTSPELKYHHLVHSQHFRKNIVFNRTTRDGTIQTSNIMILLMISVMAVFSRLPMALQ